ncbi:MAG TPA: IS4/IS5 family transposase [Hadesarchaea archaeon]|nr:IS4/IS5 family transposase [Hadesarchaea archaeon]
MRSVGYWKSYHASKANEKRPVFKLCKRVVRKFGPPWQAAKRGRPPEHQPDEHAEIVIYRKHFCMSLRVAEGDTPLILNKRVDHSDIWWSLQRISPCYMDQAIKLFDLIFEFSPPDLFIADATGVSTDRYVKKSGPKLRPNDKPPSKWRKRREKRHSKDRVLVTLKLHILIGYNTKLGLLVVSSALVTKGNAHDSPRLKCLLKGVNGDGRPLLLDAAHDSEDNYKLGKKHWFGPVIKLRKGGPGG